MLRCSFVFMVSAFLQLLVFSAEFLWGFFAVSNSTCWFSCAAVAVQLMRCRSRAYFVGFSGLDRPCLGCPGSFSGALFGAEGLFVTSSSYGCLIQWLLYRITES